LPPAALFASGGAFCLRRFKKLFEKSFLKIFKNFCYKRLLSQPFFFLKHNV